MNYSYLKTSFFCLLCSFSLKISAQVNEEYLTYYELIKPYKEISSVTEDEIYLTKELPAEINNIDDFELSQNYPNPFNPSTVITYYLPQKSFVTLKVFNLLGNEITTLVNEDKPGGSHKIEFDVTELPTELSNGIYFYRLNAGDYTETKKMIYIK